MNESSDTKNRDGTSAARVPRFGVGLMRGFGLSINYAYHSVFVQVGPVQVIWHVG